jgi:hypothetical protein
VPKISTLVVATAFIASVGLTAPPPALAQRAVVRVGVGGRGFRPGFRSPVFIGGFGFGYPYFYEPFGYPYGYGFGYGYGYPIYEGYGPYDIADFRLQITPKQAEVFVDGYHAGVVDNYDGIFQRLHLRPGGHDLVVYLPGYRTFETHVYGNPGSSQSIKMTLLPLAPGEAMAPPPVPPMEPSAPGPGRGGNMRMMPPVSVGPGGAYMQPQGVPPPPAMDAPPPPPPGYDVPPPPPAAPPMPTDPSAYGTLALRVQPAGGMGTLVLIDGERWDTPTSSDQLLVRLAEGKHHVEIRRGGFAPVVTDVDVQRGTSTPLNVSLVRR